MVRERAGRRGDGARARIEGVGQHRGNTRRWLLPGLLSTLALGISGASGCGDSADSLGDRDDGAEQVGDGHQALKTPKLCVSLKRAPGTIVADTMISDEQPNQSFGGSAFALSGPSTSGPAAPLQALFRFDTSKIPASATVLSASLALSQTNNGAGTANLHVITQGWSEATVTWASFAAAYNPVSAKSFSTAPATVNLDVLPQVKAWVDGSVTNNGLLIKQTDGFLTKWKTSEWNLGGQRPVLTVCYEVSCAAGFADCNGDAADGCEVDLSSAANCGSCGTVCATGICNAGACAECAVASTCPGVDTECQARTCIGGACGVSFSPAGMPVAAQTAGDCQRNQCDGTGAVVSAIDSADLPGDGNACTADVCIGGVPAHPPLAAGTACAEGGGVSCDGAGACVECLLASTCPGVDSECQTRTCSLGACGFSYAPAGAPVAAQSAGDCQRNQCDGAGAVVSAADNADLPNDGNACTGEACVGGVPTHPALASGTACNQGGGSQCNGSGACVECLTSATCPGNACVNGFCGSSPQCQDLVKNGAETGVDCGGAVCPACPSGQGCIGNADCKSGKCTAGVCKDVLLLGEVQSRGTNGGNDEFIEIYNPMSIPAVFDATWNVSARSAVGNCANNATAQRFAGAGQTIPAHGHLLYTNNNTNSYDGPKVGDGTYSTGILDSASLMLIHGGVVADALCYYHDAASLSNLQSCGYTCEGTPVSNFPHDNFGASGANVDVSLERKPGGAAGNGIDTNNNLADWVGNTPSNPQNTQSPASPCQNCSACVVASDCPGVDTACSVRACYAGVCEAAFTAAGTVIAAQTAGDCKQNQCDGLGGQVAVTDNSDLPNDSNTCTTDTCTAGVPSNPPKASGTLCSQNGGAVCNAAGSCVQCNVAADCGASSECATFSCVANACVGAFTAAGTVVSAQTTGDCKVNQCDGAGHIVGTADNADLPNDGKQCTNDLCTAGVPSFTVTAAGTACNQNGGVVCNGSGGCVQCLSSADCAGGATCTNGACSQPVVLLISQIQTRGSNGGNDEFIEIYNPTSAPITFDNTWVVSTRSAVGACAGNSETTRYTGAGQVIGAHKHLLLVNNAAPAYNGAVSGDATYGTGIVDAASVVLRHGAVVSDAICFYFDAATQTNLLSCATPYVCEGAPVSNLPHNNTTAGLSNSDASLERKPGGAGGNTVDTGVSASDFQSLASALPHNLAGVAVP